MLIEIVLHLLLVGNYFCLFFLLHFNEDYCGQRGLIRLVCVRKQKYAEK